VGRTVGNPVGVVFLEETGKPVEGGGLPLADQVGVDPVGGGDLGDGLLAPQDFLGNLGFEGGAVVLPHPAMIHLISPRSTV
jgi:hypothetical protein